MGGNFRIVDQRGRRRHRNRRDAVLPRHYAAAYDMRRDDGVTAAATTTATVEAASNYRICDRYCRRWRNRRIRTRREAEASRRRGGGNAGSQVGHIASAGGNLKQIDQAGRRPGGRRRGGRRGGRTRIA
jgi:hypothetical protein